MKIIPISEGAFTVDQTKVFVPFNENSDELGRRPTGSLLVEVQPFLVITDHDVLLLDAGLGFTNSNGTLQLHQNIMDAGLNPSDVTKVLMTHLHKDHSGGVGIEDRSTGKHALSFPGAKYYVQKNELEFAFGKGSSSYIKHELECLQHSPQVELIENEGLIGGYIHYQLTQAHTPYHQVFLITEGEEKIFFGGDDAPQFHQMKSRYIAKYDYNGKKCMELRQEWWEKGKQEKWTFLFYHDIKTPVYNAGSVSIE